MVMVKNANDKWRICIDYIDLNKACSKDRYVLSRIDQMVDNTLRCKMLSFMDAFFKYNQIRMVEED